MKGDHMGILAADPTQRELPLSNWARFNSPLTKSARSDSIWRREQTGVRLWRRVGRAINAALRAIVRRDTGEGYREMLERMAEESGIETPTTDDLIRLDRQRKGKRLSNQDWASPTDPAARIAKLKDGRTRLAYEPEHAVD